MEIRRALEKLAGTPQAMRLKVPPLSAAADCGDCSLPEIAYVCRRSLLREEKPAQTGRAAARGRGLC